MYIPDNQQRHSDSSHPLRDRLIETIQRLAPDAGQYATSISGLTLTRWDHSDRTGTCFSPSIGLILQGRKASVIGSETFTYGPMDCLVNGVNLPSTYTILEASPDKPLLAVFLDLDTIAATEMPPEAPVAGNEAGYASGVSVAKVAPDVLDAFSRLVDMLERPEQAPLRAPLLIREIIARILIGPQGAALKMFYAKGAHGNRVREAAAWLREHYAEPLRIDELARRAGMATSSFHREFKKVMSTSPLQFQKCLRLHEAQRLMLSGNMDAGGAGRAVGYDNVQQFNREYKRMFKEPPYRHIKNLRNKS